MEDYIMAYSGQDLDDTIAAYKNGTTATAADLTAHTGDKANPHAVTKAQVGLGNADNTSDADKPVSTAVQAALDTKAAKANGNGGFAGGSGSTANSGGAAGLSSSAGDGGAVGSGATAGDGFAGGKNAKAENSAQPIDAIQLGAGTNPSQKTMQVYDKRVVEADGSLTDVGVLTQLSTTDQSTIVSAINELNTLKAAKTDTSLFCGVSTGNGSQFIVSNSDADILTNGKRFRFVPHVNGAAGCTVKLNSFEAYPVYDSKGVIKADNLREGVPVELAYYDGKYFFNQPGFSTGDILEPGDVKILPTREREDINISIGTSNSFRRVWCNRIGDYYYVYARGSNSTDHDVMEKYDLEWELVWTADMGYNNANNLLAVPYVDDSGNAYVTRGSYGYKVLSDGSAAERLFYGGSLYRTGRYIYRFSNGSIQQYDVTDFAVTSKWSKSVSSLSGLTDDGENLILYANDSGTVSISVLDKSTGETVSTASVTGISGTGYIAGCTADKEYFMYTSPSSSTKSEDMIYVLNPDFSVKCSAYAFCPRPYDYTSVDLPFVDNLGYAYVWPSLPNDVKPEYILKFDSNLTREVIDFGEDISGIGLDRETNGLICALPRSSNRTPTIRILDLQTAQIK